MVLKEKINDTRRKLSVLKKNKNIFIYEGSGHTFDSGWKYKSDPVPNVNEHIKMLPPQSNDQSQRVRKTVRMIRGANCLIS